VCGRPPAAFEAWEGDLEVLLARSARLSRELEKQAERARGAEIPPESAVAAAVTDLAASHDHVYGGWGSKKFPRAPILELLLDRAAIGDEHATEPLLHALDSMAAGGIPDHLGGGFQRYTLDRAWRVPHYERLLSLPVPEPLQQLVADVGRDGLLRHPSERLDRQLAVPEERAAVPTHPDVHAEAHAVP